MGLEIPRLRLGSEGANPEKVHRPPSLIYGIIQKLKLPLLAVDALGGFAKHLPRLVLSVRCDVMHLGVPAALSS